MKVILLQDTPKIGKKFEIKNVADGFAINFLFPQKLAKLASEQTIKEIEITKKKYESEKELEIKEIKEILDKLKDPIEIEVKTNEEGKLFAGLDKKEIGEALQEKLGIKINSEILQLDKPIKEIGEHKIKVKLMEEQGSINLIVKSLQN